MIQTQFVSFKKDSFIQSRAQLAAHDQQEQKMSLCAALSWNRLWTAGSSKKVFRYFLWTHSLCQSADWPPHQTDLPCHFQEEVQNVSLIFSAPSGVRWQHFHRDESCCSLPSQRSSAAHRQEEEVLKVDCTVGILTLLPKAVSSEESIFFLRNTPIEWNQT